MKWLVLHVTPLDASQEQSFNLIGCQPEKYEANIFFFVKILLTTSLMIIITIIYLFTFNRRKTSLILRHSQETIKRLRQASFWLANKFWLINRRPRNCRAMEQNFIDFATAFFLRTGFTTPIKASLMAKIALPYAFTHTIVLNASSDCCCCSRSHHQGFWRRWWLLPSSRKPPCKQEDCLPNQCSQPSRSSASSIGQSWISPPASIVIHPFWIWLRWRYPAWRATARGSYLAEPSVQADFGMQPCFGCSGGEDRLSTSTEWISWSKTFVEASLPCLTTAKCSNVFDHTLAFLPDCMSERDISA